MWLPDVEIEIAIPQAAFRIHPDPSRTAGPLLCAHKKGKWWLAHPEGVTPGQLDAAAWVQLYEGIQADGTHFLLPVFKDALFDENEPQTFLNAAVELARERWVRIDGVLHRDVCRIIPADIQHTEPIRWLPHGFADLVDIGFGALPRVLAGCHRQAAWGARIHRPHPAPGLLLLDAQAVRPRRYPARRRAPID